MGVYTFYCEIVVSDLVFARMYAEQDSRKFIVENSDKNGRQLKTTSPTEESRRDGSHCYYVLPLFNPEHSEPFQQDSVR